MNRPTKASDGSESMSLHVASMVPIIFCVILKHNGVLKVECGHLDRVKFQVSSGISMRTRFCGQRSHASGRDKNEKEVRAVTPVFALAFSARDCVQAE